MPRDSSSPLPGTVTGERKIENFGFCPRRQNENGNIPLRLFSVDSRLQEIFYFIIFLKLPITAAFFNALY